MVRSNIKDHHAPIGQSSIRENIEGPLKCWAGRIKSCNVASWFYNSYNIIKRIKIWPICAIFSKLWASKKYFSKTKTIQSYPEDHR